MPAKKRKPAKKVSKKPAKKVAKRPAKKLVVKAPKAEKPIGTVTHFYTHIKVAIVKFSKPVKAGTRLRFQGATTKFEEAVKSMQYDHKPIPVAPKGKEVGIKVGKRVREGDKVYAA
ncbi:MAG TPA: translation elongation factor-like protein [Candidatus Paceibacterota bacterium]|nr:translation elongation factor-like protein [Candidatus Paceibacterota bacterium]